ncbi:hypothetical protein BC628DRAFT_1398041 [Trametes gibbosa]|nr:hypothetical protein BC628DRAFT_1398041 [Trametes gibbosa]
MLSVFFRRRLSVAARSESGPGLAMSIHGYSAPICLLSHPRMTVALPPPSVRLPPIRRIHEHSIEALENLVAYLHAIYNPPVRGINRVGPKAKEKAAKQAEDDEDNGLLAHLRSDEFERAYAVRWLTSLLSHASFLVPAEDGEDCEGFDAKADSLVQHAAALLAICAGSAAAGKVTRRFQFGSPRLDSPVEVQLTDIPLSVDGDEATVGAHTWGSAYLLAEMLLQEPARFGLSDDAVARGLRVLELGAGTGLVSLATAKYLLARFDHPTPLSTACAPTIVATDYHPVVLENLRRNILANLDQGASSRLSLSALALDWSLYSEDADTQDRATLTPVLDQSFDLIFGADIVYELVHARWVRDTVAALLRKPTSTGQRSNGTSAPRFHLLMPLRPTHVLESQAVEEVFPRATSATTMDSLARLENPMRLCILDMEGITCEDGNARSNVEVEYVHYMVGWT